MKRFIGRKEELKTLRSLYEAQGFQMAVLYGRRRIGKSTLLGEFIKEKKAIYYVATKVSTQRNLQLLSDEVVRVLAPELPRVQFQELEDLLHFVGGKTSGEKLVFVIDELPYWAEKDESILSVFQKIIDIKWSRENIFLILCGSSLSFMENKVLSEKSPLFGRCSAQIKLEAFDYVETAEFVPNYSPEEKALCYGITGGVAKYLSLIDDSRDVHENIVNQFFNKSGYLYEETRNLLVQEFTDISIVNNIIEQIAMGATTLNLIAGKIQENSSTVLYSLEKLIAVDIVEKRMCMGEEKNRKKTQYVLKDHMFSFWYLFVPAGTSAIELSKGDIYYEKAVKPRLHDFMGKVFEEMCRSFVLKKGLDGQLNCFVTQTGFWWGMENVPDENGKMTALPADVDIVGISPTERRMIVGECKFKNSKIDKEVYETLIRRARALPYSYPVVQYMFFSLGGYSRWMEENTDRENVSLYTLEDLFFA